MSGQGFGAIQQILECQLPAFLPPEVPPLCDPLQVKDLNIEEGGAFTVSSADELLAAVP